MHWAVLNSVKLDLFKPNSGFSQTEANMFKLSPSYMYGLWLAQHNR